MQLIGCCRHWQGSARTPVEVAVVHVAASPLRRCVAGVGVVVKQLGRDAGDLRRLDGLEPVLCSRHVVVAVGGDDHAFALVNRAASPLEAAVLQVLLLRTTSWTRRRRPSSSRWTRAGVVFWHVVVAVGGDVHAFAQANRAVSPLGAGVKGARQHWLAVLLCARRTVVTELPQGAASVVGEQAGVEAAGRPALVLIGAEDSGTTRAKGHYLNCCEFRGLVYLYHPVVNAFPFWS